MCTAYTGCGIMLQTVLISAQYSTIVNVWSVAKRAMIKAMDSAPVPAKKSSFVRLLFAFKQPYHYALALVGAVIFGFPSRRLNVIAVTGTKGKSTVVELVSAILDEAGYKTASASTIQFKIGTEHERNLYKMTMPGRFFLQHFLRRAVRAGCTHAVIEMTSEGVRQYRHAFVELNALIFTNLSPEHIESHGSYENYVAAKVSLARALERSQKTHKLLVVNGDDKESPRFKAAFSGETHAFSKGDVKGEVVTADGVSCNWLQPSPTGEGSPEHSAAQNVLEQSIRIESKLPGEFNLYNILAAATFGNALGIPVDRIRAAIAKIDVVPGRTQKIDGGQDFTVIVDYAHTPDSLEKLYQTYAGKFKICVLGATGGGRDKWKRPVMAATAEKYCDEVILTNDDPYDEDPEAIIREMAAGMRSKQPILLVDRRAAIRTALGKAGKGDAVLITGKGTDPFLMGPHGQKEPWDDATVVRDELGALLLQQANHDNGATANR